MILSSSPIAICINSILFSTLFNLACFLAISKNSSSTSIAITFSAPNLAPKIA
jgi:hypothetical protein